MTHVSDLMNSNVPHAVRVMVDGERMPRAA